MVSSEKRKGAKESRGEGGRGGPAEQLFSYVATAEERVPPPPATPTPPEIPGGVGGQLGPPPRPPRPPSSKRRRFSDHLRQDSSSPSPPQVHNHHHQHNNHRSPSPSLDTHPTIVHTSPPPPLPPTSHPISSSSTTLADHRHTFPAVTQTLVPPQVENSVLNGGCPDEMGMGCAIEVKKEVNYRFLPSPNATDNSHTSLLCPEMLLGSSRLKPIVAGDADTTTITKLGDNTEQSTTRRQILIQRAPNPAPTRRRNHPLPPLLSPIRSPPDDVWSSPATTQIRPELDDASPGVFDLREKDELRRRRRRRRRRR
ncbi:hypothetical protein GBAR_LOCUS8865 [Geodia barretti]|uniref:Uncharacterized protein n=1 Tax=Geodia barretti TaxID=519541 RepID=A0AA35RM80_GEOBA|nr:hypothetical protein GBAR_LOCUS8865 [Geodia barretti]